MNSSGPIRGLGVTSKPGFAGEARRAGSPKGECVKTILNTGWLKRLVARIPPRLLDCTPATAPPEDLQTAQSAPSLHRKSALSPALGQRAAWRPNWCFHNKERAGDDKPLISADLLPVRPVLVLFAALVLSAPPFCFPQAAPDLDYPAMADRIVGTLKLRPGEVVILRSDPVYFRELVAPLRQRLLKAGAGEIIELQYLPLGVPQAVNSAGKQPFEKLLARADVYIWLPEQVGVRGTPPSELAALREWLDKGARRRQVHFHWARGSVRADGLAGEHTPELDQIYQQALAADCRAIGLAQDRVIHVMRLGTTRVRTPVGTDLKFRVGKRPFNKQDGDASAARAQSAKIRIDRETELPCGVLRVAPIEESVEGVIVIPEARFGGQIALDVRLEFRRGQLVSTEARENAAAVKKVLREGGRAARSFREFGLGFNPELTPPAGSGILPYFGYGDGVVRLSLGDNAELGGFVRGDFVRWFFFPDATVEVLGRVLVLDGKLKQSPERQ